jgi:acetyl-CoA C-acetyltransferase
LPVGCGCQYPSHHTAVALDAVCLLGILAVSTAARMIDVREADVVVGVGQKSMSSAPHP